MKHQLTAFSSRISSISNPKDKVKRCSQAYGNTKRKSRSQPKVAGIIFAVRTTTLRRIFRAREGLKKQVLQVS